MKKIMEFLMIAIMGIGYLLSLVQWRTTIFNYIDVAFFTGHLIKIVLSICGFILACNNLRTKVNNKANFMAIGILGTCILLIMQLLSYMQDETVIFSIKFIECNWLIEVLQIITLMICIHYIDERSNMVHWATATFILVAVMAVLISNRVPSDIILQNKVIWKMANIMVAVLGAIGIIGIYLKNYKRILVMPLLERRCIKVLLGVKGMICLLFVIALFVRLTALYLSIITLQVIFNIVSVIYIDELIIAVSWKKVDVGVKSKNEQLLKGYIEQKTLIEAAKEIHKDIEIINEKTLALEDRLEHENREKDKVYIEKIRNNCERLLKLSSNIFELSIYEKENRDIKFEYTNLSILVGAVIESLETYIMQRGIQISFITSSPDIMAEVEKEGIERILINLISNAVKYNKENGRIEVVLTERKKRIYLCIKDSGIGIPNSYQKLIFEKFQRVNSGLTRQQEGSGLGLSIVKTLVDAHHGEIKIVSKEGKGTMISIAFPVFQNETRNKNKLYQRKEKKFINKGNVQQSNYDI